MKFKLRKSDETGGYEERQYMCWCYFSFNLTTNEDMILPCKKHTLQELQTEMKRIKKRD